MNDATPPKGVLAQLDTLVASLHKWREKIEEGLVHGHHAHTFDAVVNMILANRLYFFAYDNAFCIMEKVEYPNYSVFHCFLAGGEMEAVFDIQGPMADLAKAMGCSYLSVSGRKGWERKLAERGWTFTCVTMYLDIREREDERWRREGRSDYERDED